MLLPALVATSLLAAPVGSYENLAEAFRAPATGYALPEAAVQDVIDQCGLGWATGWPKHFAREWTDVRGYVSSNERYCILSKATADEWGQGGPAEYCLVDADSGVVWLQQGRYLVGPPMVSNVGMVALYDSWGRRELSRPDVNPRHFPVELVILDVKCDTVFTRAWEEHIRRPLQKRYMDEEAGFTPDGRFLIMTMNLADGDSTKQQENNTSLYCIDLETGAEHVEKLGIFWPKGLDVTEWGGALRGEWRARLVLDQGFDEGFYRITCRPWGVEKVVTKTYPPFVKRPE